MGESSRKIAADSDGGEVSGRGSCETNHVGVGAKEDRCRSKSEVGKDTGAGEEGCLESQRSLLRNLTRGYGFACEVSKKRLVRMFDGNRVRGVVDEPKPASFSE
jgi:hypothetical protein